MGWLPVVGPDGEPSTGVTGGGRGARTAGSPGLGPPSEGGFNAGAFLPGLESASTPRISCCSHSELLRKCIFSWAVRGKTANVSAGPAAASRLPGATGLSACPRSLPGTGWARPALPAQGCGPGGETGALFQQRSSFLVRRSSAQLFFHRRLGGDLPQTDLGAGETGDASRREGPTPAVLGAPTRSSLVDAFTRGAVIQGAKGNIQRTTRRGRAAAGASPRARGAPRLSHSTRLSPENHPSAPCPPTGVPTLGIRGLLPPFCPFLPRVVCFVFTSEGTRFSFIHSLPFLKRFPVCDGTSFLLV